MFKKAEIFFREYYQGKDDSELIKRLNHVKLMIESNGTYSHTTEELIFGAKTAWRNSSRCIFRI